MFYVATPNDRKLKLESLLYVSQLQTAERCWIEALQNAREKKQQDHDLQKMQLQVLYIIIYRINQ